MNMRKIGVFRMAGANEESLTRQLGKHIRSRRRQLGLTQEQLAEMIGVGHQALSRIEQGKMAPKMDRLPSLAQSLQCTVADLFRQQDGQDSSSGAILEDALSGLSPEKQHFVVNHIRGLAYLLKLE